MTNALADEISPYLRQHADNPVDWLPWSDAAFATARERDCPVLVSIGYSTCHWCHVMAHESFEDAQTAALMNRLLVCIKVDREEHPEVDEIYMDAVQALTGHGGWPLNAFVDAGGRPFYACTYLPRHSWQQLVTELARLWREDRPRIARAAADVGTHLAQSDAVAAGTMPTDVWKRLDQQLSRTWDEEHPGWAWNAPLAPKFPPSQLLGLLLDSGHAPWTGQAEAVLEAMQDAGIHERVGGGFHRYSVDREWRLPHFEKMLYDNAQLIGVYARAGARLGRADFSRAALNAGDYLLRDLRLTGDDGAFLGFAAAEDADDPGGEGSFYAWSPDQLTATLGAETGSRIEHEWDIHAGEAEVGPHGHIDPVVGHIPHPRRAGIAACRRDEALRRRLAWEELYPRLRAARAARPRPGRDDKVVTDLNALALEGLAALARHAAPNERARFAAAARELADVLIARHAADGLLRLAPRPGRAPRPAFITDYGHLLSALTAAFDACGEPRLIAAAERIADEAVDRLRADDGGFFTTPAGRGDLVRRSRESTDNAYPSGAHALAVGLVRLWNLTGLGRWRALAEGIFSVGAGVAAQAASAVPTLLAAWLAASRGHLHAVVTGAADDARTQQLLDACREAVVPGMAIVPVASCRNQSWACLDGRRELSEPQVLICLGTACLAPAHTIDEVQARLADALSRLAAP